MAGSRSQGGELLKFADNFMRILGMHGLSQKEGAELFGISQHTISGWKAGRRRPGHDVQRLVAQWFDLPMELLAYGDAVDVVRAAAEAERFLAAEEAIRRHRVPLKSV